uniref:Uncharacterized protein n=1 Tax=Oryza rufipogon TaxID=4529 RepID=A0A0E0P9P0_ORYRU
MAPSTASLGAQHDSTPLSPRRFGFRQRGEEGLQPGKERKVRVGGRAAAPELARGASASPAPRH